MAKASLILAFAAVAQAFLFKKLGEFLNVEVPRFLHLAFYLPAVILGIRSWVRTRTYARAWPVLLCLAIVWLGLLHAGDSDSQRGLLVAYCLTMILPVAALVDENRYWWVCAKTFVISSVVAFAAALWFEYQSYSGRIVVSLVRFGNLLSEDGSTRLANPNPVGGQLAFAAVLSLILYLRTQSPRPTAAGTAKSGGTYLVWTVLLSIGSFLTASRGAFVAWFAGMGLLVFFGTRQLAADKLRDLVAFSGMLLSVALLVSVAGSATPWSALCQRTFGPESGSFTSLGSRTVIWRNALDACGSSPKYQYFGTGTGAADKVLGEYDDMAEFDEHGVMRRNAHSVYVEWWLSYGILGTVAALILAGAMFYKAWALDASERTIGRQAILIYVILFSATIVLHRQSWWFAAGVLILSMLSDGRPAGRSMRMQSQVAADSSMPTHEPDLLQRPHGQHGFQGPHGPCAGSPDEIAREDRAAAPLQRDEGQSPADSELC